MELKCCLCRSTGMLRSVLIIPYGIEISTREAIFEKSQVLIIPYGIEIIAGICRA